MLEVIPGILEKDWKTIEQKIELVRPFAKTIHVDIIDGKFAPNTTFLDPKPFKKYADDFILELHMMVEDPILYLKPWAEGGFKRFIGHIEKMSNQKEFVLQAKTFGEVGLAIDGPTSIDQLKVKLDDLDNILIMIIKAGFSGQAFTQEYLGKVKQIRDEILKPIRQAQGHESIEGRVQNDEFAIEVDGGINDQTILLAKNAGANRFISTSFIFNHSDPQSQHLLLNKVLLDI